MWQDTVIAVGQFIFVLALLPARVDPDKKPPCVTSAITGAVLLVFAGTFASLELWYGAGTTLLCALGWLALLVQQWRLEDHVERDRFAFPRSSYLQELIGSLEEAALRESPDYNAELTLHGLAATALRALEEQRRTLP